MSRKRRRIKLRETSDAPGELPYELWLDEIFGKYLTRWRYRTPVMLRRTCRWFAAHIPLASTTSDGPDAVYSAHTNGNNIGRWRAECGALIAAGMADPIGWRLNIIDVDAEFGAAYGRMREDCIDVDAPTLYWLYTRAMPCSVMRPVPLQALMARDDLSMWRSFDDRPLYTWAANVEEALRCKARRIYQYLLMKIPGDDALLRFNELKASFFARLDRSIAADEEPYWAQQFLFHFMPRVTTPATNTRTKAYKKRKLTLVCLEVGLRGLLARHQREQTTTSTISL